MSNESVYVVNTDPNKHLPAFTVCPKKDSKEIFLNLKSVALVYHSNFKENKIFYNLYFSTCIHFWDILFWFTFCNLGGCNDSTVRNGP